jgi:uncharacterized protein YigA (DUF484 family)
MNYELIAILGCVMAPVASVVTYFATRKKRRNEMVQNQQDSIEKLALANREMLAEILKLRDEIVQNSNIIAGLRIENAGMREKIESMSIEIAFLNGQLRNVKTITKKYNKEDEK